MSRSRRGSSLWPVLAGMSVLLVGAMVLEAAGRAREDRGEVIEISSGSSLGSDETDAEDAPLLGEAIDETHAQARRLVRRGQYREAEELFDALLQKHGRPAELLSELGYVQLISGQSELAETTLTQARELAPGNAWLALTLATALGRNDDFVGAEAMYTEALRLRPHYSAAKLALGRFYRQQGNHERAIPLLEGISGAGSNDDRAAALAELGRAYLEIDRVADAERVFAQAIGRAPAAVSIRISIARSYIDSGTEEHLAKATDVLQRAMQLAPAVAQLPSLLGATLVQRGDTGAGRAAFQRSLELDPNYVYARRRIFRLDLNAGNYVQARAHAALLLASAPNNPEFHFLSGLLEARDGNLDVARQAYREAIALQEGGYPEAHMNLGKLERRAKNYDEAMIHYRKALELRPDYREARNNLGLALLAAHKNSEALAEFEALVAENPKYPEAWLNLARAHSDADRYPEAIAALEHALDVRPNYASAQLNLASALRKSGSPAEAVKVYDTIITAQPRYVSAWYNRGIALEDAQQFDLARTSYLEALKLDREHALSLKRLARLELRSENYQRADDLYTEILDLDASDAKARRLRGETRAALGNHAGCLQDAQVAQKQEPKNSNLERLFTICNETGA